MMSLRQKVGLGVFLTMNVWIIIIAMIRATTFRQGRIFDETWICFFQFLEAHIAILATCFSTFRSLFVAKGSKVDEKQQERPSRSRQRWILRRPQPNLRPLDGLPAFPSATLTGLRTLWWGDRRSRITISASDTQLHSSPGGNELEQYSEDQMERIHVQRDFSLASTRV